VLEERTGEAKASVPRKKKKVIKEERRIGESFGRVRCDDEGQCW
jgi:hypothetical protein